MHNKIKFSSFEDYDSLEGLLKKDFGFSGNQIKKANLPKNFLRKNIKKGEELELPLDLINHGLISPNYQGPEVELIFEDSNFLVFNKPYQIHGHSQNYTDEKSLLNFMRASGLGHYLNVNSTEYERGLLYRLDKVTSGVLVYAKKESLYQNIRHSFNEIAREKIYLAIVSGDFNEEGERQHYLSPMGKAGMRMKTSLESGEQLAKAHFKKVHFNQLQNISLVQIKLVTGVRHQIRCQLAALGFPILGDELYGGKNSERVFLHAYYYAFEGDGFSLQAKASRAELFDDLISLDYDSIF